MGRIFCSQWRPLASRTMQRPWRSILRSTEKYEPLHRRQLCVLLVWRFIDTIERQRIPERSIGFHSRCRFVFSLRRGRSFTVELTTKSTTRRRPRQLSRRLLSHRKWGQRCRRLLDSRQNISSRLKMFKTRSPPPVVSFTPTPRGIGWLQHRQ